MTCPKCKAAIDDDSFFCDQCGSEINVCPKCGKPGRAKVCTDDGTKLVSARARQTQESMKSSEAEIKPTDAARRSADIAPASMKREPSELVQAPPSKITFVNKSLFLEITPKHGDLFGRRAGPFAALFEPHKQVSGEHARITFEPGLGWCIADLGSTNGTKYNGTRLQPNTPQALQDKSFVLIANIEFFVRIEARIDPMRTIRA